MFESLTTSFEQDIATFKAILDAHDHARTLYETSLTAQDEWATIRASNLQKTTWHIYDHCAAFTRLYAIYAIYVDELIREFLGHLPGMYSTYDQLPVPVTTQHRQGLSTILAKIGGGGAYQDLDEIDLVSTLSHGLTGGTPYKLITEAFYTDRQNYRLDVLNKVLATLGIDSAASKLRQDSELKLFIENTKPDTATIQSELEQFIKRRNEAAHSQVTDIVATDEIKRTADFISHLGKAVARLLSHAIIKRQFELGQLHQLGTVEAIAYNGFVVISHFDRCMIRLGDRLAFAHKGTVILATVIEIQLSGQVQPELLLTTPTEVGIKFDRRIQKGATICALREQQTASYEILQTVAQRKDDIIDAIADRVRLLNFSTDDGRNATCEGIDSTDFDAPNITEMSNTHAELSLIARITFTAIIPKPALGITEADAEPVEQQPMESVQSTVSIPVKCRTALSSLTTLENATQASIQIEQPSIGTSIVFTP